MVSRPTSSFLGHFNDGETAASHEVYVTLGPDGLLFGPEGKPPTHHWTHDDLRSVKSVSPHGPAWLTCNEMPDARLIVGDADFAKSLLQVAPQVGSKGTFQRTAGIVLMCIAGLGVLAGIAWILLSVAPSAVASMVPEKWWQQAGTNIERTLMEDYKRCHGADGKRALAKLSYKFSGSVEANSVRVYDMPIVNAFAMAGGRVVITNELIKRAKSPDEVAGVLAHELGHVKAGHPETQIIRVLGLQIIMSALWGGSGIGDYLAQGGAMLSVFSYTRAAEREADQLAIELMKEARVNPLGLADFFESVKSEPGEKLMKSLGKLSNILSTHPGLDERIEKLKEVQISDTKPALSDADWLNLKSICK